MDKELISAEAESHGTGTGMKPRPKPRSAISSQGNKSPAPYYQNHSPPFLRSKSSQNHVELSMKPVPLPRSAKGPDKPLGLPVSGSLGGEGVIDPEDAFFSTVPDAPSLLSTEAAGKRGTINIFQLAKEREDPFDDFDSEFDSHFPPENNHSYLPPEDGLALQGQRNTTSQDGQCDTYTDTEDVPSNTWKWKSKESGGNDFQNGGYFPPKFADFDSGFDSNLPPISDSTLRGQFDTGKRNSGTDTDTETEEVPSNTWKWKPEGGANKTKIFPPSKSDTIPDNEECYENVFPALPTKARDSASVGILSAITFTSPLNDLDEETRRRISTFSSISSNSSEHYSDPPPPRPLQMGAGAGRVQRMTSCPAVADDRYEPVGSEDADSELPPTNLTPLFPGNKDFTEGNRRVTLAVMATSGEKEEVARGSMSSTESSDSFSFSRGASFKKERGNEYDDVAIEDGTVVFLDNLINSQHFSSSSTSSGTLEGSSRDSIVAEFDPLLVMAGAAKGDKTDSFDLDNTPRYEYIDEEDGNEDGRSSHSNSNNEEAPDSPANSRQSDLPAAASPITAASLDFKANPRRQKELTNSETYEPVRNDQQNLPLPPPPPPKPERKGGAPQTNNNNETEKKKTVSTPVPISGTSPAFSSPPAATPASFFRRFSSKFRLKSIREEDHAHPHLTDLNPWKPCYRDGVVFSTNLFCQLGSGPSSLIGRKEWQKKRVVLAKGLLSFYNDKQEVLAEVPLEKVLALSVATPSPPPTINGGIIPAFFELFLTHSIPHKCRLPPLTSSHSLILGAGDEGERGKWMGKYMEAQTLLFTPCLRGDFQRGGWAWGKEQVTANWRPIWLLLQDRTLFYSYADEELLNQDYYEMDLRKARSIEICEKKEPEQKCPFVENCDVLTIDVISRLLYIQTESGKVTAGWERAVKGAAVKSNGPRFEDMQLTNDNVPVIVDKCIDFLYAHGTLAEGIYRQSGSNARIAQLLSDFQKDAWAVQINQKEFTAHDVAGTLKRFFRTLKEPLVTSPLYEEWIQAASMRETSIKQSEYLRLLSLLPAINYGILKKLICHLFAIHELNEKNLMPIINLAPIWGPTLLSVDGGSGGSYDSACAECEVVKDLIQGYYELFNVDEEERNRERKVQDALETFHVGTTKRKCSGDMKLWIYLWEKEEHSAVNVTLTPVSTAAGITAFLLKDSRVRNMENVSLHEIILGGTKSSGNSNSGGTVERPLHPSEKVIDTVLRWSVWEAEDRKDNYLILKKNTVYPRLIQYAKEIHPLTTELRWADRKSKAFGKRGLQFIPLKAGGGAGGTLSSAGGTLRVIKGGKDEVASWPVTDLVFYFGVEGKRTTASNVPTKHVLTIVTKTYNFKRTKEEPFFGWVSAFPSEEELHRWGGALTLASYPEGLYPLVHS